MQKRSYALDAVKVLATTCVLFHHFQQVSGARFEHHINFWGDLTFNWWMMVEVFFMLSGFFAWKHTQKMDTPFGAYIGRKLGRLLPVMAVSTTVYCGLYFLYFRMTGATWVFKTLPNFWGLIVSCLGLQEGFGFFGYSLNNPTWFVSVLILCYVYHFLLVKLVEKCRWRMEWVLVFMVFFCQGLKSAGVNLPFVQAQTVRGYQAFSMGLLLGFFLENYKLNKPVVALSIGSIALFLGFVLFAPAYTEPDNTFVFLCIPSLILLSQTEAAKKLFRHRFWSVLSEISYNTYVWHLTVQIFLCLFVPSIGMGQSLGAMYLFALLAWLVGTASHFLLEKPLRTLLPKWWGMVFVREEQA